MHARRTVAESNEHEAPNPSRTARLSLVVITAAIVTVAGVGCGSSDAGSGGTGSDVEQLDADRIDLGDSDDASRDGGDPFPDADDEDDGTLDGSDGTDADEGGETGDLCEENAECRSDVCAEVEPGADIGFCTEICVEDADCPEGWECVRLRETGADAVRACLAPDLCIDEDEDGYGLGPGCDGDDCDDSDPSIHVSADEICDGLDNDCDDRVDDNPLGINLDCETGFSGPCALGRTVCDGGLLLCEPRTEPTEEVCDGEDNDCDGEIDEDEDGDPLSEACYEGPEETEGVGLCAAGTSTCVEGVMSGCEEQVVPVEESCDGLDNDCDEEIDEEGAGEGRICDTGEPGQCSTGVSSCADGELSCEPLRPASEEICDGEDNDCDGEVDRDEDGQPLVSTCYDGPEGTEGVGACRAGTERCEDGRVGACEGQVLPAAEACNGVDDDCDGEIDEGVEARAFYPDVDGDRFGDAAAEPTRGCSAPEGFVGNNLDCDDADPFAFPGAPELCDGVDNDCNGAVDDGTGEASFWPDTDGDGFGDAEATPTLSCERVDGSVLNADDCDDDDREIFPGATEHCDGADNDCDGEVDLDEAGEPLEATCFSGPDDALGVGLCRGGVSRCIEADWTACEGEIVPADEICDDRDNDCDGIADEGLERETWYRDSDGDGFGTETETAVGCRAPEGYVAEPGDCDDGDPLVFPGAAELSDGIDNDCDGEIDEDTGELDFWPDADGDGFGDASAEPTRSEEPIEGAVTNGEDCDDENARVNPDAPERCDGLDNDCDGDVDEEIVDEDAACETGSDGVCAAGRTRCFEGRLRCVAERGASDERCDGLDNDCDGSVDEGDGGGALTRACYDGPEGTAGVGSCVEGEQRCVGGGWSVCSGDVGPSTELCDGLDNDCDGVADERLDSSTFYRDADGDGFGDPDAETVDACTPPEGFVADDTDCDDSSASVFPGADELCDGLDNDCDGAVDDDTVVVSFWPDRDGDGYGDALADAVESCAPIVDHVRNEADCNDSDASISPDAEEICDAVDNDCDGERNEDEDGEPLSERCYDGPAGTEGVGVCAAGSRTCRDRDWGPCTGATLPAEERCDGLDNDCDGAVDDGLDTLTWYPDEDGDGFGNDRREPLVSCERPDGYSDEVADCDDTDPSIYPGAPELCDGEDNDCDGDIDDGAAERNFWPDSDGDGFGDARAEPLASCEPIAGFVPNDRDCNDDDAAIRPGTAERCDGVDNDCDGGVDETFDLGAACTSGTGECAATGETTCSDSGDAVVCDAVPGEAEEERCDGLDNDCDGAIDEAEDGAPLRQSCYDGPADTEGIGACFAGEATCEDGAFGACMGQITPSDELCDRKDNDCDGETDEAFSVGERCTVGEGACERTGVFACAASGEEVVCGASEGEPSPELCDGLDNDCDGSIDEGPDGGALIVDCYDGPEGTEGIGACSVGTAVCVEGAPAECEGQTLPDDDVCDGVDNDCNGEVDDPFVELGELCAGGVGACRDEGIFVCADDGGGTVCTAVAGEPEDELCDGVDNDCDEQIDEEFPTLGEECSDGLGVCETAGVLVCTEDGTDTTCGAEPPDGSEEICDGLDNDCDGEVDDGLEGVGVPCSDGVGACLAEGVTFCESDGAISCSAVPGEPSDELCDGEDNDCDGATDEGADGAPLHEGCYEGPDGTAGIGICETGVRTCEGGDWSECRGQILPHDEECDGLDNDCNGGVDDNGEGGPLERACFDGDPDLVGVGECEEGVQICSGEAWTRCLEQTLPSDEVCDGRDNDCNGTSDDISDDAEGHHYYLDFDGDGFGDPERSVVACTAPDGYVANANDCYDRNARANPTQSAFFGADRGDGSYDYNCDGEEDRENTVQGRCESVAAGQPCSFRVGWQGAGIPRCGQTSQLIVACDGFGLFCGSDTLRVRQRCR